MASLQFGNYYAQQRIAQGGMASLYLAGTDDGKYIVIRTLHSDHLKSRTHVRQFENGCNVLSKLNHPNIPHYVARGRQKDGVPWVAMEYVPAKNLREVRNEKADWLLECHMTVIQSMARGLHHVHERGFLHMDFKPENVLVLDSGEIKLIDFDLAVPRPMNLTKLPLAGTAVYMAPELLLEQPTDDRADIFAFGVTIFEMLTGRKPFGAGTPQEFIQRAKSGAVYTNPPSMRDYNPKLSPKLDRIVRTCLAKKLEDRYPVVSLIIRDLQTLDQK